MLIRHFQNRDLITFEKGQACREVYDALCKHRIRRALIVHEGKLIGMVTDRDLIRVLSHSPGELSSEVARLADERPVGSIMQRELLTLSPTDHMEDAAKLMHDHKIGGLPVISNGELIGIITESDIFRAFVGSTLSDGSLRVTIDVERVLHDQRESPVDLVRRLDLTLCGLTRYHGPGGREMMVLRVEGARIPELRGVLTNAGWPMIEQRRSDRRDSA